MVDAMWKFRRRYSLYVMDCGSSHTLVPCNWMDKALQSREDQSAIKLLGHLVNVTVRFCDNACCLGMPEGLYRQSCLVSFMCSGFIRWMFSARGQLVFTELNFVKKNSTRYKPNRQNTGNIVLTEGQFCSVSWPHCNPCKCNNYTLFVFN